MKGFRERLQDFDPAVVRGRVDRFLGALLESRGLLVPVGSRCRVHLRAGRAVEAEVVGFRGETAVLALEGSAQGIGCGDVVEYLGRRADFPATPHLLGRVVGPDGRPLDGGPLPGGPVREVPLELGPRNPLERPPVRGALETGIRAIDALFTVGLGQRLGVFAGSGVGKSQLLAQLARQSECDAVVLALIGERGREVRDFLERELRCEERRRTAVIVSTVDEPPLRRIRGAFAAIALAEALAEEGRRVLLLVDSLTRVAMAQREIGLALGEPAAARGYPPSVFGLIQRLVERVGPHAKGSVTAFFTALAEEDDFRDPVLDAARASLDGHLWLARGLAEEGHFPAIDPLSSVSRLQPHLVTAEHLAHAARVRALIARYRQVEDLLRMGAYVEGGDAEADLAVRAWPPIRAFLKQDRREREPFASTVEKLSKLAAFEAEGSPVRRLAAQAERACRSRSLRRVLLNGGTPGLSRGEGSSERNGAAGLGRKGK